ncbi:MAG: biotin--[acetyl-CoA-carboxylase] ligase [Candidatus Acetothermia bacterium]
MEETSSTNDLAKKIAQNTEKDFVVRADRQSSGRGRRGRGWNSPPGGLYFSLCTSREKLLPIKASLAVGFTLEDVGVEFELKWPNDVLAEGKKLCGILTEVSEGRSIVGIGINVEIAPLENSINLAALVDEPVNVDELMQRVIDRLFKLGNDDDLLQAYRSYCSTIGSHAVITTPSSQFTGLVRNVDNKGRIILQNGKRVTAGDVVHLRKGAQNR